MPTPALNFPVYDVSHYLVQLFQTSVSVLVEDTSLDPALSFAPHCAPTGFYAVCGGGW